MKQTVEEVKTDKEVTPIEKPIEIKEEDTRGNNKPLNVYQKLKEVQYNLKAPKSQYNKFGKYNYRNCEDILTGVKPWLNQIGAIILLNDEVLTVDDPRETETKADGKEVISKRIYIKATATFIDVDTGDKVESVGLARESYIKKGMDDSQVSGTASSYARKYALNGLLLIDDTKDADFTKLKRDDVIQQIIKLHKLDSATVESKIQKTLKAKNVVNLEALTDEQFKGLEKWLIGGGN